MDLQTATTDDPPPSGYHAAAAVLSQFDPESIRSAYPTATDADFGALLADCTVMRHEGAPPAWSLRLDVRQQVLQRLGTREAMLQALEANPVRPHDGIQEVFETYLRGGSLPLEQQDASGMKAVARVVEWTGDLLENVPSEDVLKAHFDRDQLLLPLRALADRHFSGRSAELGALRDFVGVLPPTTLKNRVSRGITRVLRGVSRSQPQALMVHGLGGVGKSTLIAHFLLEHIEAPPEFRFPYVYLDFDRSDLNPQEPVTLVAEAARQLAAQFPEVRADALELRAALLAELHTTHRRRRSSAPEADVPVSTAPFTETIYRLLQRVARTDTPVLVVLDTFELVQHRGPQAEDTLWRFLERLRQNEPRVRVVLSGRAPMQRPEIKLLPIGNLDDEAAFVHLASLGVTDPVLARTIFDKVTGHPLCLRLAARLVQEDAGLQALDSVRTRDAFLMRLDAALVQGMLYERLLGQLGLRDKQLFKLAHPGLVLRRVTPDIILHLLAGHCGLELTGADEAQVLFDQLRNCVWVVEQMADGSLRHRPDLRSIMLPLLVADTRFSVASIHAAAVQYYDQRSSPPDRAEEIYHRLMLGQGLAELRTRWLDGVERDLWPSYEELPVSAQITLRTLAGAGVDEQVMAQADPDTWERLALAEVRKALALDQPDAALRVLEQRRERAPQSRLWALQAQALLALARLPEALTAMDEAIEAARQGGHAELLHLLVLRVQLQARLGQAPTDSPLAFVAAFDQTAALHVDSARLLELGALALAAVWAWLPGNDTVHAAAGSLQQRLMDLWAQQPSSVPDGENFGLAFFLVGALYEGWPERVRERLGPEGLGAGLASAAVSELGTSHRSCRDLLAQLARAVDAQLPARSRDEAANAWLESAEGTAQYGRLAYTYGRLLDELMGQLPHLPATEEQAFLRLLRQVMLPAAAEESPAPPPASTTAAAPWPVETVLLKDGLPFLGRPRLREFLRLLPEANAPRLLVVNGPRRSGKSYSLRLMGAVAEATQAFSLLAVALEPRADASALARDIGIRLGLPPDTLPTAHYGNPVPSLARWLLAAFARQQTPTLLAIDDLDQIDLPDTDALIGMLVRGAVQHDPPGLRVVLLGYPAVRLGSMMDLAWVEELHALGMSELRDFLDRLRAEDQLGAEETTRLLSALEKRLASAHTDQSNPLLNDALRTLARQRLQVGKTA